MLKWKVTGFVIFCITSVAAIFFEQELFTIFSAIFGPLLLYALFQLKKDGIPAWAHLTGKYPQPEEPRETVTQVKTETSSEETAPQVDKNNE